MCDELWADAEAQITSQIQREQQTATGKLKSDQLVQLNMAYFQSYQQIY